MQGGYAESMAMYYCSLIVPSFAAGPAGTGGGSTGSSLSEALDPAKTNAADRQYSKNCVDLLRSVLGDASTAILDFRKAIRNMRFWDTLTATVTGTHTYPSGRSVTAPIKTFFDPSSPNFVPDLKIATIAGTPDSYWLTS